jgi:hypothetical protein
MVDFDKDVNAGDELAIVAADLYMVRKLHNVDDIVEPYVITEFPFENSKIVARTVFANQIEIPRPHLGKSKILDINQIGVVIDGEPSSFEKMIFVKNTVEEIEKAKLLMTSLIHKSLVSTISAVEKKLSTLTNHLQKLEIKKHES